MLTLYHAWDSFQSFKVRFCLDELQLDWESKLLVLTRLDHLRPEFLKINPDGLVPVLRCNDEVFRESSIINEYLKEQYGSCRLTPTTAYERAKMREWCRYQDTVVHAAIRPPTFNLYIKQRVKLEPPDEFEALISTHPNRARAEAYRDAVSAPPHEGDILNSLIEISHIIKRIDATVRQRRYLVGDSFTLADIAMGALVERLDSLGLEDMWRPHAAACAWADMIRERPAYDTASVQADSRSFVDLALADRMMQKI